jgi:hypothetical protein
MASDDAAAALRTIESPGRADLLAELDARRRDELARLLAHRPGSAAGLMRPTSAPRPRGRPATRCGRGWPRGHRGSRASRPCWARTRSAAPGGWPTAVAIALLGVCVGALLLLSL